MNLVLMNKLRLQDSCMERSLEDGAVLTGDCEDYLIKAVSELRAARAQKLGPNLSNHVRRIAELAYSKGTEDKDTHPTLFEET